MFSVVCFLSLLALLFPAEAIAWGPSAHIHFGLQLFDKIALLPAELQTLLSFHKQQFLYGSISADIIVGKRFFITYRHHCHNWKVGLELLASAKTDALKSFILGYLCHLAADTVAHNLFVPLKIIEAYPSPAKGHLYWEVRYDNAVTNEKILDMFYALSQNPYEEEDHLLQTSLKPTLFSFKTNKRIFNGLLILQRLKQWQVLMGNEAERDPQAFRDDEVEYFNELSVNAMLSFLIDREESRFFRLDPTGDALLEQSRGIAKALRGQADQSEDGLTEAPLQKIRDSFQRQLEGETV